MKITKKNSSENKKKRPQSFDKFILWIPIIHACPLFLGVPVLEVSYSFCYMINQTLKITFLLKNTYSNPHLSSGPLNFFCTCFLNLFLTQNFSKYFTKWNAQSSQAFVPYYLQAATDSEASVWSRALIFISVFSVLLYIPLSSLLPNKYKNSHGETHHLRLNQSSLQITDLITTPLKHRLFNEKNSLCRSVTLSHSQW